MMTLAISVLLALAVQAQGSADYRPFIEEGKTWIYEVSNPNSNPYYYEEWTETFQLTGDTLINSHNCKKLYHSRTGSKWQRELDQLYGGALFEEEGKVYIVYPKGQALQLLYDFSCKKGDSRVIGGYELEILEKLNVSYAGVPLHILIWSPKEMDQLQYNSILVEGIGSPDNDLILYYDNWLPDSYRYKLLSCNVNGTEIFNYDIFQEVYSSIYHAYHPFIEDGKIWRVDGFSLRPEHTTTDYYFSLDEAMYVFDGREYFKMCSRTDHGEETIVGFFREEDQRVYLYDEKAKREYLIYDFTLKEGDRFEPEYGDYYNCEVMKVGTINVNGENLKTITFEANSHRSDAAVRMEVEWIEGVGLSTGPIEHDRSDWEYFTAYVYAGSYFLPFSFDMPYNGWHGCPFTPGIELPSDNPEIGLTYELVPDPEHDSYALHVYGTALLPCCQNHYVYCIEERGEDLKTCKLHLSYEEVGEAMDCERVYALDLYFRFFEPDAIQYIVVDQDGSEHSLWINDKDRPYRPFIEEGKVWRTGIQPGNDYVQQFEYKFYNDTIIGGKTCKVLGKSKLEYYSPEKSYLTLDTTYVGVLYEENGKVYRVNPENEEFTLIYDFISPVGMDITVLGEPLTIARREKSQEPEFKGIVTELQRDDERSVVSWMEGVGCRSNPLESLACLFQKGLMNEILISCSIDNGEIIFLKEESLPYPSEVKKKWLDFTHVVKPKPKSPQRVSASKEDASEEGAATSDEAAEPEMLTGEYSARELFVSLKTLTGAYTVTLTDAAGKVVYRKDVQTSNVVALNTLLTDYPDGEYTLTVENAEEQYTALLSLPLVDDAVRDLQDDKSVNGKSVNGKWSDLSGRHLNSWPTRKGIYIKDGRKVLIK